MPLADEAGMSEYERAQGQAIRAWKEQEPSVVSKAVGYLFAPIVWLVNKIIPQAALRGALDLSDTAGKWMAQIGTLKSDAGVKEFSELRRAPLHECDRLADSVRNWAVGLATAEGGITGFFGLPGMVADVPLVITFALRTIHRVGLCYGFEMNTEEDRKFVLGILAASGANSIEEKLAALTTLRSIEVTLTKQTWKKMAEQAAKEALSKEAGVLAVRNLAKQLGVNLTKRKALQSIPYIGAGVGASVNHWYIKDVGWAARRAFQERWLRDNQKIIEIV
jgi:hypothetical protein